MDLEGESSSPLIVHASAGTLTSIRKGEADGCDQTRCRRNGGGQNVPRPACLAGMPWTFCASGLHIEVTAGLLPAIDFQRMREPPGDVISNATKYTKFETR